jgi:endoglucanase
MQARDNIGGWHDAGDYGRYVVNSGISTGTLLWAWEIFGQKLKNVSLKIPESGNGTPDILNEARWNLEWVLKMQDDDGGVWHKQTSETFPAFIAPQDDKLPSEVIGVGAAPYKSTCATADLAAVGAIAARVYKPFDAKFAARALEAARRAWAWTEKNPNVTFRNPPGITTGEYADANCNDERLWAAAELGRTTGEPAFNSYFLQNYTEFLRTLNSPPAENWSQMPPMALWTYAASKQKGADAKAVQAIRNRTIAAALGVVDRTRGNPYRVSLKTNDYVWGSNGVAAGYGMYLLIANVFSPDSSFVDAARDNLHYLLGRNTFSLSWVTQVGENPSATSPGRVCSQEGQTRAVKTRCWQCCPRVCRRPKFMPISWDLMQAMRLPSTGRHRSYFFLLENCNRKPDSEKEFNLKLLGRSSICRLLHLRFATMLYSRSLSA